MGATGTKTGTSPGIRASAVELMRSRAEALRRTARSLDPIAADAFERRARQLERGIALVETVMRGHDVNERTRTDVA